MALNTQACFVWKSILFLQISEIKFLGKWNHERWQSEANVTVTLKTGEKRDQMRITVGAKALIIR